MIMKRTNYKITINPEKILLSLWCIYILYIFVRLRIDILNIINTTSGYVRLFEFVIVTMIVAENIFIHIHKNSHRHTTKQIIFRIFMIAMIIRICTLPFFEYIPTNDFANYFEGACYFSQQGFKAGIYDNLNAYGIPSFAGQVIINGLILRILSPTLLGFQLLNCIYTSGICVMIYLLLKDINSMAAVLGATFYTFYPSNILSTQITTPHHGASFFMLFGLYLYYLGINNIKLKTKILSFCFSALSLVISNYYHPSAVIIICALIIHTIFYELNIFFKSHKKISQFLKERCNTYTDIIIPTIIIVLIYIVVFHTSLMAITKSGYFASNVRLPNIYKLVVGFNFETSGSWNAEDYNYMMGELSESNAMDKGIRKIKERLSGHACSEIWELMVKKTENVWFSIDNYFSFHIDGKQQEEAILSRFENFTDQALHEKQWIQYQNIINDISITDRLFVYCMWSLALIGILSILLNTKNTNILYLLIYIPLGWMLFIMISEAQSRYRYQGMTIIILLAGYGFQIIYKNSIPYMKTKFAYIQKLVTEEN